MEVEMESRVKPLLYKIRATSRETQTQKALHVLDSDLRTHWSTGTNTKEWILLELEEPCLLSHIRIHNKSVLEWEISIGLRYKPETFSKVRPRCEAPRRDMLYPMNYMPCRFVKISCLRGNPIAIFFVQLIGIAVPGLEQEFQPIVEYLLPHIVSHKHDSHDMYLQLLHDITFRLSPFIALLEADLANFSEAVEPNIRFFSMLAGPFYPILAVVSERQNGKVASGPLELDSVRGNQTNIPTISSNFQVQQRRGRGPSLSQHLLISSLVFRPDAVLLLLKEAFKDCDLGNLCRIISRILRTLTTPVFAQASPPNVELTALNGPEESKEAAVEYSWTDYSQLFGEDFKICDEDASEIPTSNILDIAAIEEALLHILFACASQRAHCKRLADPKSDLVPALPFIQAMLPALRPAYGNSANTDNIDETFWQWQTSLVQTTLTQIAAVCSSATYRPLLQALSSYLSSYSPLQAKAACILIDLCSGPLAPWIPMVIAKVDLTVELLEDLLGVLQGGRPVSNYARSALIYLILALSGHMDDLLPKFKEVKQRLLFVIEMLEPFLIPAITTAKNTIAFGEVSAVFVEKQEQACAQALDFLRTAVKRPAILPALESEWRKGNVAPSVLLSILAPHIPLPSGIDFCWKSVSKSSEIDVSSTLSFSSDQHSALASKVTTIEDEGDGKSETFDATTKVGQIEDGSLLFAPTELKCLTLESLFNPIDRNLPDSHGLGQLKLNERKIKESMPINKLIADHAITDEYFDLQTEYLQLVNYQDRELKASEFVRFAEELHAYSDTNIESRNAAIDALLLAAECHLNPYFVVNTSYSEHAVHKTLIPNSKSTLMVDESFSNKKKSELEIISNLEDRRDRTVIGILLQAAAWENKFLDSMQNEKMLDEKNSTEDSEDRQCEFRIFSEDMDYMDAVTLLRQNQGQFCRFIVTQLQKEQHNIYEVLLHGLLFYLQSATKLYLPPENIVDVILQAAERLNKLLLSSYHQQKDTSSSIENGKADGIKRQWKLLQKVISSTTNDGIGDEIYEQKKKRCFHYRKLVPVSAWMSRIPRFSASSFPFVRYIGWMAIAAYLKGHCIRGSFLVQDIYQMTMLLSVFFDELTSIRNLSEKQKEEAGGLLDLDLKGSKSRRLVTKSDIIEDSDADGFVHVLYPELDTVFPNIRSQHIANAEIILDMVCLYIKSIHPSFIPDILVWFSEFCADPFSCINHNSSLGMSSKYINLRGGVSANLKFILIKILEVIILEHMEAVIPEMPRMIQILLSLCRSSYCDVPLLDSVLSALKPLISYAVSRFAASDFFEESNLCVMSFESLCFDSLICELKSGPENRTNNGVRNPKGALLIFLTGSLLSDLSITRRGDFMQALLQWTSFTNFEATTGYYNYVCAFQKVFEACTSLTQESLKDLGVLPDGKHFSSKKMDLLLNNNNGSHQKLVVMSGGHEINQSESSNQEFINHQGDLPQMTYAKMIPHDGIGDSELAKGIGYKIKYFKCISDVEEFMKFLQSVTFALSPTLEICWRFHPRIILKLSQLASQCLLYAAALASSYKCYHKIDENLKDDNSFLSANEQISNIWQTALESFAQSLLTLLHHHCWQVSVVMIDSLLLLPSSFDLTGIMKPICSALKHVCCHAPKINWRLQAGKWLSKLFERQSSGFTMSTLSPLVELFTTMLEHPEPEQRNAAILQLSRIIELEQMGKITCITMETSRADDDLMTTVKKSTEHGLVPSLVGHVWDRIASLAAFEPSMIMRRQSLELLYEFIPYSQRHHLQSIFSSIHTLLPVLLSFPACEGQYIGLGLSLLARACLYSELEDVNLLPEVVWDNLELLAKSKNGHAFSADERSISKALLKLKEQCVDAKEALQEALMRSSSDVQQNSDLLDVRESILQVLAKLNCAQSKYNELNVASMGEAKELEEIELELEILQKAQNGDDFSKNTGNVPERAISTSRTPADKARDRLKEIKAQIRKLEISEIQEEILARRERQRMAMHARQMKLQEAALREIELLQELDRERIADVEHEIERQRVLERERTKTREMRYNLEVELERRTQREIQRELEQRESNLRSSRRDFPPATTSRPRERYRERDGRPSQESAARPTSSGGGSGGGMREGAGTPPPMPPSAVVAAAAATVPASSIINVGALSSTPSMVSSNNSRIFSAHSASLVQAADERSSYDDYVDGSRDAYDTSSSSIGDPEIGFGTDMMNAGGAFGAPNRQLSRGGPGGANKPRQIVERRDRENRREGKWERKQG